MGATAGGGEHDAHFTAFMAHATGDAEMTIRAVCEGRMRSVTDAKLLWVLALLLERHGLLMKLPGAIVAELRDRSARAQVN